MKISRLISAVASMPEKDHWPGHDTGKAYDRSKSEVIAWLSELVAENWDVKEWLFRYMARKGAIWFNPETRRWQGADVNLKQRESNSRVKGMKSEVAKATGTNLKRYTEEMMLNVLRVMPGGMTSQQWFRAAQISTGMSRRTFYLLLDRMSSKTVVVRLPKDWKWNEAKDYSGSSESAASSEAAVSGSAARSDG